VSSLRRWELLGRESLQDCKVFKVTRAMVRSPRTGDAHPFYSIEADPWVNVVPVTAEGEVVMVRQFRHGTREFTLEIPGGIVDPDEDPALAAARELIEETGYHAARVRSLGSLNPNPALFGNRVHSFLAEGVVKAGDVQNGPLEETEVELVPARDIPGLLLRGEIDHALVVAALQRWLLEAGAR
jgi:8-oxo-dGTP pyrophosphatase MutT (NUDIX family)